MVRAQTIAAIASAGGAAERAVLRVSGPGARATLERLTDARPDGRGAAEAEITAGGGSQRGLVLWMPGPASFTGEDVLELHVLGQATWSLQVLEDVLAGDVRLAEPGEFTRRAFENGRLDLTRAEGVAALVEAETRDEARAALALLGGGLERRILGVREFLERARSLAEASLDFDEADTGHVPEAEILGLVDEARGAVGEAQSWERRRSAVGGGDPVVVLTGAPNAGKSTLFNLLIERAGASAGGPLDPTWSGSALVSDEAGTTRDVKRVQLTLESGPLGGRRIELVDTAGRLGGAFAGRDALDRRADELSDRAVRGAALVLWVFDASLEPPVGWPAGLESSRTLVVWNQVDRARAAECPAWLAENSSAVLRVSGRTGAGLDALEAALARALARPSGPGTDGSPTGLGARHLAALRSAEEALARGRGALTAGLPLDVAAEELRAATEALDAITGRTTPEDLLTRIFAQFCLGK